MFIIKQMTYQLRLVYNALEGIVKQKIEKLKNLAARRVLGLKFPL